MDLDQNSDPDARSQSHMPHWPRSSALSMRRVAMASVWSASAVRADGKGGPTQQRVVFSINLTTTDGLFSAQNFEIQPNDLVLATESALVNVRTVLGLFSTSLSTVRTAQRVEAGN